MGPGKKRKYSGVFISPESQTTYCVQSISIDRKYGEKQFADKLKSRKTPTENVTKLTTYRKA